MSLPTAGRWPNQKLKGGCGCDMLVAITIKNPIDIPIHRESVDFGRVGCRIVQRRRREAGAQLSQ